MNFQDNFQETILSRHHESCYLCAGPGELFYCGLQDRLFGAPGDWNLRRCSNPGCGLVWLDPMPLPEEIYKAYQNYYTHQGQATPRRLWWRNLRARKNRLSKQGYLSRKYGYRFAGLGPWTKLFGMLIYFEPNRRAYADLGVAYQKVRSQGRSLDIGCGNGWILEEMAALGWQVEGIDPDPAAVAQARKKGFKVQQGDLQEQNYPGNYFDTVSLCHVIEHVHDPVGLLRECYRILKPGGRAVIITPNMESWAHRLFRESWLGLDPPRHLYLFSLPLLRQVAQMAGFTSAEMWTNVREAEQNFLASRSIRCHGKYNFGNPGPQPWARKLWARSLYLTEWLILPARPHWGEEIVAILEK
jgi:2-polyprenyl-3-methyl-5-hydroxy-6-metoxy-1,4-benzoquinol methylase